MASKRSKQELKKAAGVRLTTDNWSNILSFLKTKEHARARWISRIVNTAGGRAASWSPLVECDNHEQLEKIWAAGCQRPAQLECKYLPRNDGPHAYQMPASWMTSIQSLNVRGEIELPQQSSLCPFLADLKSSASALTSLSLTCYPRDDLYRKTLRGSCCLAGLQVASLRLEGFLLDAMTKLQMHNLTMLRLEMSELSSHFDEFMGLLQDIGPRLTELGIPRTVHDSDDSIYGDMDMPYALTVRQALTGPCTLDCFPNLVYLYSHFTCHDIDHFEMDMLRLLNSLPKLQRVYALPFAECKIMAEVKHIGATEYRWVAQQFEKANPGVKCGLVETDFPKGFELDERVRKQYGNNKGERVAIVYSAHKVHPNVHPFNDA